MSAGQQMPPWLQEQIGKLQQAQQNLQSIMAQKQQVEMDSTEADKALEELKKANDDDQVFKHAGSILIKSTKKQKDLYKVRFSKQDPNYLDPPYQQSLDDAISKILMKDMIKVP